MKHVLLSLVLSMGWAPAVRTQSTSVVRVSSEGLVAVEAGGVRLDDLLAELDRVVGTESSAPEALGRRTVSVAFEGLPLDRAIREVFEGLGLDYAVVGGARILVLSESRSEIGPSAALAPDPARGPRQESEPVPDQEGASTEPSDDAVPENPFRRVDAAPGSGQPVQGGILNLPPSAGNPLRGVRTTPFGVPLEPVAAAGRPQPFESILGNVPPTVLDVLGLTGPPEGGRAPVPRPLPGMPTSPPPAPAP